jgi:rhodanese-related sulfurtransferase
MSDTASAVLQFGSPEPFETACEMSNKLRFHTDSWDLAEDLKVNHSAIMVIDARSQASYLRDHIPGAISFPHRTINETAVAELSRSKTYVVYCDGIGCNASTKGAYKLAALGFCTKELLGGLDWWRRDGHPVVSGSAPGNIHEMLEPVVTITT